MAKLKLVSNMQFDNTKFTKEEEIIVAGSVMVSTTIKVPPKISQARVIYEVDESVLCGYIVDKHFINNFGSILPKLKNKFPNHDDLMNFVIPTLKCAYRFKSLEIDSFLWKCFLADNEIFKKHHWYQWKSNFCVDAAFVNTTSANKIIIAVREFPSFFAENVPHLGVLLRSKYKDEVLNILHENKKMYKVLLSQSVKVDYDLFVEISEKYGMPSFSALKTVFLRDNSGWYIKKQDEEAMKDYISEKFDITRLKKYDVRDAINMFPKLLVHNDISKFNITSTHYGKWVGPNHPYAGTKEEYETKLMYLKMRD